MLKKVVLLFVLIAAATIHNEGYSQEKSSKLGKVGVSFSSFGANTINRSRIMIGGSSYHIDGHRSIGLMYIQPISKTFEIETGVEHSQFNITVIPKNSGEVYHDVSLINIPLMLRANFFDYFFVNGGVFMGIDRRNEAIDSQTGIGAVLGFAVKYDFDFGGTVFVNPYGKIHTLKPFNPGDFHQSIWESGIRFGFTYNLGKL
jgi:hypothetical protein